MKNKFNQINKKIILNYAVRNTTLRKQCIEANCIILFCWSWITKMNCRPNYTGGESLIEKIGCPLSCHIYVSNILRKNITEKVKTVHVKT